MSDIGIDIPAWAIVLVFLWVSFLPLTAAAIGTAIWAVRKRTSRIARVLAFVCGGLWLVSAGLNVYVVFIRTMER